MGLTRAALPSALMSALLPAVLATACATTPARASEPPGTTTVGVGLQSDTLSNGTANWHERTVRARRDLGPRRLAELALVQTRRFDLNDTQIGALYAWPVDAGLDAAIEANASPSHRVLARNALGATVQYEFAPAWLLHGGARSTGYDTARVNQALLMLERYVGAYSWAVAWRPARAFGATVHSAELRAAYYYGDKNSISLSSAFGREAGSIGSAVRLSAVRTVALTGRHWIDPAWAVNYGLGHTRQGDFYTRRGISVGLAHVF
jgi:YaiO family outer membrane protein